MQDEKICTYCGNPMNHVECNAYFVDPNTKRVEQSWVCSQEECLTTVIHIHEYRTDDEDTLRPTSNGSSMPS